MTHAPTTSAGWYDDPDKAGTQRYWNGQNWTDQRQPKPNRPASAAPVLGIIGAILGLSPLLAVFALILGVLAVIFGAVGWRRLRSGRAGTGKGKAMAGLVLGIVAILISFWGFAVLIDEFSGGLWFDQR